jgi:hypothetical protein
VDGDVWAEGLRGPDGICQLEADYGSLPGGTDKAWIASDATDDPVTTFVLDPDAPYVTLYCTKPSTANGVSTESSARVEFGDRHLSP